MFEYHQNLLEDIMNVKKNLQKNLLYVLLEDNQLEVNDHSAFL